jgi:hypothetical protein
LESALELRESAGDGEIYWVANTIDASGNLNNVEHAYFVPSGADGNSFALNQADTGFTAYPSFTVDEVKSIGLQAEFDSDGNVVGFNKT